MLVPVLEKRGDNPDRSAEFGIQFVLEAVGGARHFLKTAAVARFVIPFCFGIAARGEIDSFRRFVVCQIEDGAPADRVRLFGGLGVERGSAGAKGGGRRSRA